ncbi:MAG TPA: type II toxin-antitoxin system prevent-host-death family antitoxin [Acidisoma sp.]|jgi:prevent-host-death family protein|nr:type II toxin-antitoxin system prevent-host-death family antitoxin [Acidisoma sp.]
MSEVSVAKAKAEFAALVSRAEAGECITVTRNGKPVACLGPAAAAVPFPYGDLVGKVTASEDLSLPDDIIDAFEASEPFP